MEKKKQILDKLALIGAVLLIICGLLMVARCAPEEPVARTSEDHVWLRKESVSLTATGTAGAATGSASTDRELHGTIYAVYVDFTSGISATTDFALMQDDPSLTIMRVTDYYTDTWYYTVVQQTDSTGSGTSTYQNVVVQDTVDISACQTTSGTVGTVTIYWGQ